MPPRIPIVTLTTDFGRRDPYVASMKGVIRRSCPEVRIDDLSHEIAPQDRVEAALFAAAAFPHFPTGTVHCIVVDPGVGTARAPVVAAADGQRFVFPDNGLLSVFLRKHPLEEARRIENPDFMRDECSATFHGRDIFAPAAGKLAAGMPLEEAGPAIEKLVELALPEPAIDVSGIVSGCIIHVDRFGNCITNLREPHIPDWDVHVCAGPLRLQGIQSTYGDVATGQALTYFGSSGRLEIAVSNGDAATVYQLKRGDRVVVYR